MLAKITPAANDFKALARYLVSGKPGTPHNPNRVAWTITNNLPTDDAELAAKYMAATARLSARTRKAAYHLMIAWHVNERPTPEIMQDVARRTLDLAGLGEHQALIMGHGDKPHPHLHILLNRVHPETGRAWKTAHDYARFDRIMEQLAGEFGYTHVPAHAYHPDVTARQPKKPNSAATYAARHGASTTRVQWSRHSAEELGELISENLTTASTWADVEHEIHKTGLQLERKGGGLVVGNAESYAKFSSLGLHVTAKGHPGLIRQRAHADTPSVFSVDAVDIVRAFIRIGLADRDDLARAVNDANQQRAVRRQQRQLSQRRLAMLGTVLTGPQVNQTASPSRSHSKRLFRPGVPTSSKA